MAFKASEFSKAELKQRIIEVKCPELKAWFEEGTEPVFQVRGLTGEEFYNVREAVIKRRDLQRIASKLLSGGGEAIAHALDEMYGAVPDELARRVEILVCGCVEPKLDRPAVVKLFKHFPSSAHVIADEILRATGEGSTVGELSVSGGIPASATTST